MTQSTWFIVLAALAASSSAARAESTRVNFGIGTSIAHIAELSQETRDELGPDYGDEYALGFGYKSVALFGLNIWTWNGGYCIYTGRVCDEISAERTAEVLAIDRSELPRPWSYSVPPGLVLILLAIAVWRGYARWRRSVNDARPNASDDPRYQRAVEIVVEGTKKLPIAAQAAATRKRFSLGVDYLVEQGIEKDEASEVLLRLVDTLLDFRRRTAGH